MDETNGIPSCEHVINGVDEVKIEVPLEVNTQHPRKIVVEDSGTEDANDDFEHLILKSNHFIRGKLSKGKDIIQDDNQYDGLEK